MKKQLLSGALLVLVLASLNLAMAETENDTRDENQTYRRTEDTTPRTTPGMATVEAAEGLRSAPTMPNPEMESLREGFSQRRDALLNQLQGLNGSEALEVERSLENLTKEQNIAELTLLIGQADAKGNTEYSSRLREALAAETAPVPAARNTEPVLSHEQKLQALKAGESRK